MLIFGFNLGTLRATYFVSMPTTFLYAEVAPCKRLNGPAPMPLIDELHNLAGSLASASLCAS